MSASLVGSEMCIRDSISTAHAAHSAREDVGHAPVPRLPPDFDSWKAERSCLLYTSDAADDM
eukprot:12678528-Alexandrium_andersonii.AAC.1